MKGSFTGANETRAGFFQAADGGTIFLDEIGNASSAVQSRLLRVLQEKEITMIGAVRPQKINVRVIAATNVDLYGMVQNGTFREDLYYRLNVVNLRIPPLRERMEDIPILARAFIQKFSREFQRDGITITEKAMELLMRHSWPGNIRELENVIQRAIIMCDGEISIEVLPDFLKYQISNETENSQELLSLQEVERNHIMRVLRAVGNNKTKAAEILQIDRKTLRQKIQ